jgi:hypothetical protein
VRAPYALGFDEKSQPQLGGGCVRERSSLFDGGLSAVHPGTHKRSDQFQVDLNVSLAHFLVHRGTHSLTRYITQKGCLSIFCRRRLARINSEKEIAGLKEYKDGVVGEFVNLR